MINIKKLPIKISPSFKRTLIRPFVPGSDTQVDHLLYRLSSVSQNDRKETLTQIYELFSLPKEKLQSIFRKHFEHIKNRIPSNMEIQEEQKEFIGAYFTQQYALESTAVFNPSIIPHPVQDKKGITKFIISLRSIGEGHISSITFMEGEIDKSFNITLKEKSPFIFEPERKEQLYEKALFIEKLGELNIFSNLNRPIFDHLSDHFTFEELETEIQNTKRAGMEMNRSNFENSLNNIRMLARSNFTLAFSSDDISERAIYPASPSQSNGLEDARFVRFTNEDEQPIYYAIFTAYDGRTIMPEMLETYDFKEFKVSTLNGSAIKNKDMALFPRKINDQYMMLGRQDNESLYIMTADNPYFWHNCRPIVKPTHQWELVQMGNCGSPIEIEEGWLVLTHGVGSIRTYSLGAILLDKDEPWRVIGRLSEPLLSPKREERLGYVPNVFYTCGALVINRTLVMPYAIGDSITTFALVSVDEIIAEMKS